MSETTNIAAISEKISTKLFNVFGWNQFGPTNFNFKKDSIPGAVTRGKYPCDVIFGYEDPYLKIPVYLLTDLKSYGKSTLENKSRVKGAITSLGYSLLAAQNSSEFNNYLPDSSGRKSGLLFIYNHDREFDYDFPKYIKLAKPTPLEIPMKSSVFVIGPPQIEFLLNVYNDLEKVFGSGTNMNGMFRFHYPNMIANIPDKNEWKSATIEMLLSAIIPVVYDRVSEIDGVTKEKKFINLYYRESGASYEEFCFIFDYLFRYNVIDDWASISIRMANRDPQCSFEFSKAKDEFSRHFYIQDGMMSKLDQIQLEPIPSATYDYNEFEIGMEKRKEFANV